MFVILLYLNVFDRIRKRIAMASKRKRLILKEKIEILEFRACNTHIGHIGVRAFVDNFSVSKTQISYIIASGVFRILSKGGEIYVGKHNFLVGGGIRL